MLYGDTYCGIYCGACSVLRFGETGRADAFVECLGGVPRQELACGGCKSDTLYVGCRACELRRCAVSKGVAHCHDCREFPCKTYTAWRAATKLLPHVHDSVANVATMRRRGVDEWLAEQARRWSCPQCGTPFSWYATRCGECGRALEAHALTGLRRLVCRVALPLIYRRGKRRSA